VKDTAKWQAIWLQLVRDATYMIEEASVPLSLHVVTHRSIQLNGNEDHDDFYLEPIAVNGWCKTASKPYDTIVTAILVRASQLAGTAINVK
jgi:hypothetical protein